MARLIRQILLEAGASFVRRIVRVPGVKRVALLGSVTTDKASPKDIDFLLTVSEDVDMKRVAAAGRTLKGQLQGQSSGADVFLCSERHEYIGRTCNFRECHCRVACEGGDCRPGSWRNTDFHVVKLDPDLCANPPVIIWPEQKIAIPVPQDVRSMLESLATRELSNGTRADHALPRGCQGP